MAAHWSFGPSFQPYRVKPIVVVNPPASSRTEVLPLAIESDSDVSPEGIRLYFRPYDPATEQAPTETRICFLPDGAPDLTTADELVSREYPFTSSSEPIGPEGASVYLVPHPAGLPEGERIAKVLCYFSE